MARECIWCGERAPVVKLRMHGKHGTRVWCCSACRGPIGWIWKRLYGDRLETPVVSEPATVPAPRKEKRPRARNRL